VPLKRTVSRFIERKEKFMLSVRILLSTAQIRMRIGLFSAM
jgi:hypothetical protein